MRSSHRYSPAIFDPSVRFDGDRSDEMDFVPFCRRVDLLARIINSALRAVDCILLGARASSVKERMHELPARARRRRAAKFD